VSGWEGRDIVIQRGEVLDETILGVSSTKIIGFKMNPRIEEILSPTIENGKIYIQSDRTDELLGNSISVTIYTADENADYTMHESYVNIRVE